MSSFFEVLFCLFGRKSPQEKEKRRLLLKIKKEIKHSRYKDYYKPSTREVMPRFAEMILDIDKTLSRIREDLLHAEESDILRSIVIEECMSDRMKKLVEKLSLENVKVRSSTLPAYELKKSVQLDIDELRSIFTDDWKRRVDETYRQIIALVWMVQYDYFSLLQKLDMHFSYDMNYKVNFLRTHIKFVSNDIKDFLSVAEGFDHHKDWNEVFEILRKYNVQNLMSVDHWQDFLKRLNNIFVSKILTLIICHGEDSPHWENMIISPKMSIANQYIVDLANTAMEELNSIINKSQVSQIDTLLKEVFGSPVVHGGAKYYTKESEKDLVSEGAGFIYIDAFNWIMAFEEAFFAEMNEICDTLLVYGQWNNKSQNKELSLVLQDICDTHLQLINFDNSLDTGGEIGNKIKTLTMRITKGTRAGKEKLVSMINETCKSVIENELQQLKILSKYLQRYSQGEANSWVMLNISNIKTVLKMVHDKNIDIENILQHLSSFFNLMKHAGFDIGEDT
ncbi:MAG: hypothetical protein Ta2G_03790 [Termitinemataceae bacterium]|nr:MAG: hypothetical protein Ta2G_03790 [Termitinemataceae bacterium]